MYPHIALYTTKHSLTKNNQLLFQCFQVDYIEGTSKHSQSNQEHRGTDTEGEKQKENC